MSELKKQTVSGVKWVFVASVTQRIISFGATVILARILNPADFGLFALAMVMIDGFGIFKSLGFDSALVRRKDDIDKACNTAFFLIPAMGMILFFTLFFAAPYVAKSFGNPSVTNVVRVLGIIFVISCFGKVPQTVLYRDMKFKFKSIAEMSAAFIYSATAVVLALNKFGVWSLVIAYVLKTLIQVAIEWYFSKWKPKFEFDKTIAWDMFHFGKYVLASGLVLFLYNNLDNLVIGRILGVTMLGYYAISMNVATFLSTYFLGKVGMIMYPGYSKIQDNEEDVKRVMLKIVGYISIVAFPFALFIFIFAPDILRIVFGEKWLPAVDILRILALVGLIRSIESAIWPIFLAKGKSKVDFQIGAAQVIIFFILVIPFALKFKLIGVGLALLVSTSISFYISLIRIKRIINLNLRKLFGIIKPAFLGSLLMLITIIFLKPINLTKNVNYEFIYLSVVLIVVYLSYIYSANRNFLKDAKEVFAIRST